MCCRRRGGGAADAAGKDEGSAGEDGGVTAAGVRSRDGRHAIRLHRMLVFLAAGEADLQQRSLLTGVLHLWGVILCLV